MGALRQKVAVFFIELNAVAHVLKPIEVSINAFGLDFEKGAELFYRAAWPPGQQHEEAIEFLLNICSGHGRGWLLGIQTYTIGEKPMPFFLKILVEWSSLCPDNCYLV